MTKRGLPPGIAHNPDPTFSQASANITQKARRKAQRVVYVMSRVAEIAKYQVVGEIALKDENGNLFHVENGGR